MSIFKFGNKKKRAISSLSENITSTFYLGLSEKELRDICRNNIDTFENWSRRLIDEQFRSMYGNNYFNYEFENSQPLIKNEIKRQVEQRMRENPNRFPRKIDAIVIENISYFFCRDDLYSAIFKSILEKFFSGPTEVCSVLGRIVAIRNKLAHGTAISIHEAEQCICYTNDFIETFKSYYQLVGKGKEYNVPLFVRIKDSLGHDIIREDTKRGWDVPFVGDSGGPKVQLRSGDHYKIWAEVDSSFDSSNYSVSWGILTSAFDLVQNGTGTEITFIPTNKWVSHSLTIRMSLTTNKDWHRIGNLDDMVSISLADILPPIEETY